MRSPSTVPTVLAGLALLATTACGADDAKQESAELPSASGTTSESPATDQTAGAHPEFTATDYRYTLLRVCRCAFTAPVTITVRDGRIASAVAAEPGRFVSKGDPAPDTHRLTIDDLIDLAEDPSQHADVTWPDDQAWPDSIRTDPNPGARDDEVTYTIKRVQMR